jgi:hypothetical protein
MLTSLVIVMVGGCVGQQPDQPPFFAKYGQPMMHYYESPDPGLGTAMLKDLLRKENIDHPWFTKQEHVLNIIAAMLGDIAAGNRQIVRQYEAEYAGAPLAGRRVIARSLLNCGDKETLKQIDAWLTDPRQADVRPELEVLKTHLEDPNRKHVRDQSARSPHDLDLLWANFFITGEYASVSRILDVIDRSDTQENATMKRVAQWSVSSNPQQHPRLVELVEKHAKERPQPSRKVIDDLVPKAKDANELKAALLGRWISRDDEKVPLEFLKDGSVKIGFIKEKDVWLIATGPYSVEITVPGKRSVKCIASYQGSTLHQSWTLKDGDLIGSHGPNPVVHWVRAKDN